MKISSYGSSYGSGSGTNSERKQDETKRPQLESLSNQNCSKPALPITPNQVEACLPKELMGLVVDYASNEIKLKSFKECTEIDPKKLEHFNIRFSREIKQIIKYIFHESSSSKTELFAHVKPYSDHYVEQHRKDIENCFSKFKASQASRRGVKGIDLDLSSHSDWIYTLTGENTLTLLEQYFITKNIKTLTIGDLGGEDLERFFDLLANKQVELDFLKIRLDYTAQKTNELTQLRKALVDGRLKVKQISLVGSPALRNAREYGEELIKLIDDRGDIHLEGLDIYIGPALYATKDVVGDAIKRNQTLKSIRMDEDLYLNNKARRANFIGFLKENKSIKFIEFKPYGILETSEVKGILNEFKKVLDTNRTLTDLRISFSYLPFMFVHIIDLHIHQGRLVGVEKAHGLVEYEVLEDFPEELRPEIHDILIKLNQNAHNTREIKLEDKKELEEKKSD